MKIAHEAPISIFNEVDQLTDYNYALVHLLDENRAYRDKFMSLSSEGREIILDNSIFELGTAFNSDVFVDWVKDLQPTWYIIPDALEDKDKTLDQFDDWMTRHDSAPGKKIGVVQGKNIDEVIECYNHMVKYVDKIAISFDYSFFESMFPYEQSKYISWLKGRVHLLHTLLKAGVIDQSKPHHLLGCGLPQEFLYYRHYEWIDSVDTSNPVVHGIMRKPYKAHGLDDKESIKLCELIDTEIDESQFNIIKYNISMFRGFCK